MIDETKLDQWLNSFPTLTLLVVGDFFLDKYLDLDRRLSETSLETGLEAYQVVKTRCSPGAAGTVTNNLRALDVQVIALSVIGDDGEGYELQRALREQHVDVAHLLIAPDRVTPTYTKPMMREPTGEVHELNRLDIKNRVTLPKALEARVVQKLRELAPQVDGIIVADQVPEANCGVITDKVRIALAELGQHGHTIVADSRTRIGQFRNVMLKPNAHEAIGATHKNDSQTDGGEQHAGALLRQQTQRPVFVTLGADGILVVTAKEGARHVPGVPVSGPLDIVGAGDSVMAGIAASLCAGARPWDAAIVGNLVASITIQQIGTTGTASRQQVRDRFCEYQEVLK